MKQWWSQFRISNRLDEDPVGDPAPRVEGDTRLHQFAERAAVLDRALSRSEPGPPPPFLHGAIMAAVRDRGKVAAGREVGWLWQWAAPAAVAILLATLVIPFGSARRSDLPAPNLALVRTTWRTGADVARVLPSVALSPLHEELDRVNQDLDRTAQTLLASVPGL